MTIPIFFAYIFFLSFIDCTQCVMFLENYEFQRTNISILERFISQYKRDHRFVIHQDATMFINVEVIIKMLPTVHLISEKDSIASENIVNIFLIHNSSNIISHRHSSKVFNQDSCNLFLTYGVSQKICLLDRIELASASFIFDVEENQIFSCFTENGDSSLTLVKDAKLDFIHTFHRTYRNLRGRALKVYFIPNEAIVCKEIVEGKLRIIDRRVTCNPTGPDAELVKILSETLNFVPEFWSVEQINRTTVWNDLMSTVSSGEADFAAGSVLISADGPVCYTSFTTSSSQYLMYFVNPTKEFNLVMILKSFDLIVYIISASTLIFILIVAVAFAYFFNSGFGNDQCTFTLIKMVVEQGSNLNTRLYTFNTMRVIISIWLIFNIIFTTAFKSKISAALIKPEVFDLRNVEDLNKNDFFFFMESWFLEPFNDKYSLNKIKYKEIPRENYENVIDLCPLALYTFKRKFVLVHAEYNLVRLNKMCRRSYPQDKLKDQIFLRERNIYYGLALTPSSPYKKQFSMIINLLKASGLLSYWYSNMTYESLRGYNSEHSTPKPLILKQMTNFIVLLGAGYVIAFTVLILEIFEVNLKRKWNIFIKTLEKL